MSRIIVNFPHLYNIDENGKLRDGFTYILNQEKYLKLFLTDEDFPIDNNASE